MGVRVATETVTVVFTDLVGSTALLSRVGEDAAEVLRREHFGLLRGAFGPSGGREVKNLGDGLMVVFPSAADAVAASVAAQQAFERRNRRAEHALLVRVGIAAGDADVDDGDYFGVPVVEAARLCARAEGAEILASDLVRLLAGTRGGFEFETVGDLDLRGLDGPVAACRVRWEPAGGSRDRAPLPVRLASAVTSRFVGRDTEYDHLMAVWKSGTTQGERRVVMLGGEPGIGKTTLAARFAGDVYEQGTTVLYGRCDEDLGVPYQPWIEALTALVDHAPEDVLIDHVADRGGDLARLVPALARRVPVEVPSAADGDSERFVLFGCVIDLLARASQETPILVVLDDLHWADRASVQLLRHVSTADGAMPVMVLGTFRDSEVGSDHPVAELLARLHREPAAGRMTLHGLTHADLSVLLEQIAGHEMTDAGVALRDAVLAETAGNPFFVGEILRHLAETGAIYQDDDGQWVADTDLRAVGLPVSVKEVVGQRLAGLGGDSERVLGFAAVIGRDFDIPLLVAVAQIDEDTLIDLCDNAVAAAVLHTTDDPDRYTFAHALIEHTLHDGLSPARRVRAHRAIAEHLEALHGHDPGDHAGELAHHWAATTTDATKAIHYAYVAGTRALDQLAPDDALGWFTRARGLIERSAEVDPRRRAEVLVGLGDAQRQCGLAEHRETLLEAGHLADRLDAVDLLVSAALANQRGSFSVAGGVDQERIAVIDRALERLDDPDSADRARLLALGAAERYYHDDIETRLATAEQAIATARRSNDDVALVKVLDLSGNATREPSTLDQRAAWANEACALADEIGDPVLRPRAHTHRSLVALEQGDRALIRTEHALAAELSERVPDPVHQWISAQHRVWIALLDGDLADAEGRSEAALTLGLEIGQPDAMTFFGAQLAAIRYQQGRLGELIPLMEQALADAPALYPYRAAVTMALARSEQPDRAREHLRGAHADGFDFPRDNGWTTALSCFAEASVLLGDRAAAEVLRDLLTPFHRQIVTSHITVSPGVAHWLGMLDHLLGHHDQADTWFTQAMALHERVESPLLIAHTQAAWAALLADRDRGDDRQRARTLADQALTTATAGGYGYITRDATTVLNRLG